MSDSLSKKYTPDLMAWRIAKLPKWAQDYIRDLKHEVENVREINEAYTEDAPVTGISATRHTFKGPDAVQHIAAPRGIDFHINGGMIINVRKTEGGLYVSATGYPTQLAVFPRAANVVTIRTVEDDNV